MSKAVNILQNVQKSLRNNVRNIYSVQQNKYDRKFDNFGANLNEPGNNKIFSCETLKNYCQNIAVNCWKCGKERKSINDLFCDKCSIVQNPHEYDNYFKVFDLAEDFDVDHKQLTLKYRKMQSLLHPDKFSNRTTEEQQISETYSTLVNKAYDTLQIPMKRAQHMLSLRNEKIEETNEISDKEFLMEIMELNEEIDEADTPEKLKALEQKNKQMLSKITQEISEYFSANDIIKAKESIIKMKYFSSINSRINNLLREQGIVD